MTTATQKRPERTVDQREYKEALAGIIAISRDLVCGYREQPYDIGLLDAYVMTVSRYADENGFGCGDIGITEAGREVLRDG